MLRFDHSRRLLRTASRGFLAVLGIGVFLSGCGFIRHEPREPWRAEAEATCMRAGIVKQSSYIRPTKPIDGPGPCGADLPLKVSAFQNDHQALALSLASTGAPAQRFEQGLLEITVLKPEATLGCPMVAWTDDWIATAIQPAAMAWFGQGVKEIRTAGSYACRRRNHQANARLSEHAFGNALDIMAFVLNDGNVVTVKNGWRGNEQEQGFLRDVFHGACQRFRTVLGPGSDALHYDHFHVDLAHHDARGQRRYCKPQVAAPQRPAPGTFGPGVNPWGGPPNPYAYRGQPALPQQQASVLYNRPPAQSGLAMPSPNSGMIAPAPSARTGQPPYGAQQGRNGDSFAPDKGQDYEVEPDFDPSQFDIVTGSMPDLPRPRGERMPGLAQPLPPRTTGSLDAVEPLPAPRRPVARSPALTRDPAGK